MVKTNKKLVSIIGLGYVGLPLLVEFSKYNHVIGIDNDNQKIKLLKKGISYISDVPNIKIKNINNAIYTNDFSLVKNASTIIIGKSQYFFLSDKNSKNSFKKDSIVFVK